MDSLPKNDENKERNNKKLEMSLEEMIMSYYVQTKNARSISSGRF